MAYLLKAFSQDLTNPFIIDQGHIQSAVLYCVGLSYLLLHHRINCQFLIVQVTSIGSEDFLTQMKSEDDKY